MPIEIERKFLLKKKPVIADAVTAYDIKQGYLYANGGGTLRVRIQQEIDKVTRKPLGLKTGILAVKTKVEGSNFSREEKELEIPLKMAKELMHQCGSLVVKKTRFLFHHYVGKQNLAWEVDLLKGSLKGMMLAEIELPEENYPLTLPDWLGKEVTMDKRYKNKNLAITQTIPKNYKGPK